MGSIKAVSSERAIEVAREVFAARTALDEAVVAMIRCRNGLQPDGSQGELKSDQEVIRAVDIVAEKWIDFRKFWLELQALGEADDNKDEG